MFHVTQPYVISGEIGAKLSSKLHALLPMHLAFFGKNNCNTNDSIYTSFEKYTDIAPQGLPSTIPAKTLRCKDGTQWPTTLA